MYTIHELNEYYTEDCLAHDADSQKNTMENYRQIQLFCSNIVSWFKQYNTNVYLVFLRSSGLEAHHKALSLSTTHAQTNTLRVWLWRWRGLLNGKSPMFLCCKPVGHSWTDWPPIHSIPRALEFYPTHKHIYKYIHTATHKSSTSGSAFSVCVYFVLTLTCIHTYLIEQPKLHTFTTLSHTGKPWWQGCQTISIKPHIPLHCFFICLSQEIRVALLHLFTF